MSCEPIIVQNERDTFDIGPMAFREIRHFAAGLLQGTDRTDHTRR